MREWITDPARGNEGVRAQMTAGLRLSVLAAEALTRILSSITGRRRQPGSAFSRGESYVGEEIVEVQWVMQNPAIC